MRKIFFQKPIQPLFYIIGDTYLSFFLFYVFLLVFTHDMARDREWVLRTLIVLVHIDPWI